MTTAADDDHVSEAPDLILNYWNVFKIFHLTKTSDTTVVDS